MQEWKGREILYPNDMHFFMQGRDTLNADSICMYKIITYIDSIGCMSCKLQLREWLTFIEEMLILYFRILCIFSLFFSHISLMKYGFC